MKKIFFSFLVLFSVSLSFAQAYQVFSMHMVRVEGDLEAFEKVQSIYMQKVAQNAVENGDIAFWAFLKRVTMDNIDNEERMNYLFVQSNNGIDELFSEKNSWWNNASKVLSKSEQAKVEELSKGFKWTKDARLVFQDEVSIAKGLGKIIQFNFARPKDLNGFIAENQSLWKNHFDSNMEKMGMVNWGVGRKLAPLNSKWSTAVTWDMFNSLEELMKYRANATLDPMVAEQSKMATINPEGFTAQPIFQPIVFAVKE
jgi:hypothetical protein